MNRREPERGGSLHGAQRLIPARTVLLAGVALVLLGLAFPAYLVLSKRPLSGTATNRPIRPDMIVLPAGEFWMGSPEGEAGRDETERRHRVRIPRDFAIGQSEVTQGQWRAVMGGEPSHFQGDDHPVESVSWWSAVAYLNRLSEREGLESCYELAGCEGNPAAGALACTSASFAGKCSGYRLPSEAEWEYAARSGTEGPRYAAELDEIAWWSGNSDGRTHRVMTRRENPWKLRDMLGNVAEWVHARYGEHPSDGAVFEDELEPALGTGTRVARGCDWQVSDGGCRAAARVGGAPSARVKFAGFRPARWLGASAEGRPSP